jgi:hypothetical protein
MQVLTDEEVLNGNDDLEMLRRPHLWAYPVLPLKKPELLRRDFDNPGALGVLLPDGGKFRVLVGNMFFMAGSILPERQIEYDSPEAVLADGWVVD